MLRYIKKDNSELSYKFLFLIIGFHQVIDFSSKAVRIIIEAHLVGWEVTTVEGLGS